MSTSLFFGLNKYRKRFQNKYKQRPNNINLDKYLIT